MTELRLLVTGGAGFIGSNFAHYWVREHLGSRLVVLDALTYAGNRSNLDPLQGINGFRFVHGDILDQDLVQSLLRSERLNTLVHFAAESHVDRSILGPAPFVQTNVVGTCSLLQAAKVVWIDDAGAPGRHRFHHVSTDEVYGSLAPDADPFVESTPYDPSSPYAASKAASDHFVRAFSRTYGLHTTISNCSNNYGPYHYPEKLIPLMIVNALRGQALPVYGDGGNIRDWLYVEDHCRAIELILHNPGSGETFNIGGYSEVANIDLVRRVCRLIEAEFRDEPSLREKYPDCPAARGGSCADLIRMVADRPGHDRRYAMDAGKLERTLGFKPRERLDSGLRKTIRWYLDNDLWWRKLLDRRYQEWIRVAYGSGV